MLRAPILLAARNKTVERIVTNWTPSRAVVDRFVGGADYSAAVGVAEGLIAKGLTVTMDHLGEDVTDVDQAQETVRAYQNVLTALHQAGLTGPVDGRPATARADVSVKLSAVGQALPGEGQKIALDNALAVCAAAEAVGATVTLDMEDHTTTDSTLEILRQVRVDFPATAAVLQAYLRRTEGDCRDLAVAGSRVRLCKGAYAEPESVAFQERIDVDLSYVRCMNILLAGDGYPMLATHDPRMIEIAEERSTFHGKKPDQMEFQMLYGIRPTEQARLAAAGRTVRVYVPYGSQWFGYLMRRLAERPANLGFFARALATRS